MKRMGDEIVNIEYFAARLHEKRAELDALPQAAVETVELDQSVQGRLSRMDALQQQEMAREHSRRTKRERARIDAALARIASGEYGYCLSCAEPIARARLELDPATPHCIAHAK